MSAPDHRDFDALLAENDALRSLLRRAIDHVFGESANGKPLTDAPLEIEARRILARTSDPDREACRRAEGCAS